MAIATAYGTGTINASLGAGGTTPSVTVTATITHTTSYNTHFTARNVVKDVEGIIGLSGTRLNATQYRVSADRQLPAGEEIVFDWTHIDGVA